MEKQVEYVYMYPVVDITDNDSPNKEIVWIDLREVEFVATGKTYPIFHKNGKKYKPVLTIEQLQRALGQFGFLMTDRCNTVNVNKIHSVDTQKGLIYFDEEKKNTSASVAGIYIDAMRELEMERQIEKEIKKEVASQPIKHFSTVNLNF